MGRLTSVTAADELVGRGLADRSPDPAGGRRNIITITPAGTASGTPSRAQSSSGHQADTEARSRRMLDRRSGKPGKPIARSPPGGMFGTPETLNAAAAT
jgi:hypothetical protein